MQCRNDGCSALVERGCNGRADQVLTAKARSSEAKHNTSRMIFARMDENKLVSTPRRLDRHNKARGRVVELSDRIMQS